MCLDCEWLWQALYRPFAQASHSLHSGQFVSGTQDHATEDTTNGSSSNLSVPLLSGEVNDVAAIAKVLDRLSSGEVDEQRATVRELRLLAKESPEKKILIARAGAISLLVNLLSTRDPETQEHAVTTLLNLSIINANKEAIVRAGAINPIVGVLKSGSMEARENAAATLFSLSVLDENKVTIGKSQAFPALVDLLKDGTMRGKHDAASALFNLSLYDGNKPKAVSADVVAPLVKLLDDSSTGMVDVALAILSLLVTHKDARAAIGNASAIPVLIDLIRSGSPGNKENSLDILLALCEFDPSHLVLARQLGALSPLAELGRTGIPRARRKATRLVELLNNTNRDPDLQ